MGAAVGISTKPPPALAWSMILWTSARTWPGAACSSSLSSMLPQTETPRAWQRRFTSSSSMSPSGGGSQGSIPSQPISRIMSSTWAILPWQCRRTLPPRAWISRVISVTCGTTNRRNIATRARLPGFQDARWLEGPGHERQQPPEPQREGEAQEGENQRRQRHQLYGQDDRRDDAKPPSLRIEPGNCVNESASDPFRC